MTEFTAATITNGDDNSLNYSLKLYSFYETQRACCDNQRNQGTCTLVCSNESNLSIAVSCAFDAVLYVRLEHPKSSVRYLSLPDFTTEAKGFPSQDRTTSFVASLRSKLLNIMSMNWAQRKIFLYNVTFGLYMLDPWERYLFNALVIVLMWFIFYNGYRNLNELCKRHLW
ncbi:hypothetical protein L1887_20244 [Cichorium endivia]|nr:hypothetical protein L1887_20244 [Cichorium endivia]